jgi:hypothetical protein
MDYLKKTYFELIKFAALRSYNLPFILLILFPFYITYDLYTNSVFFSHDAYAGIYYPFREWFIGNLLNFEFPLWNPFWGIGHEAVVWSTVPIDFYSILEIFIKPHYEYFFLIHCMAIVLCGYYVFRKWDFNPWRALIGVLLFYMSPVVTTWTVEFVNTNTFIAHIFIFFFMVKWFETGKVRYPLLMGWTFFLGMFGTKMDLWFFELVYFFLVLIIAFFIMRPKRLSMVFLPVGCILVAIIAQAWQINILVNALYNSNRMGVPHGLYNLFSSEMYRNLYLSLGDREHIPLAIICTLFFVGVHKKSYKRIFFIAAGIVVSLFFKFWEFPFLIPFLRSPVFFGAIIATIFVDKAEYTRKQILSAWILFMLPAYYWCVPMIDFDESHFKIIAPVLFKGIWSFLVWMGCLQMHRNRTAKLAYLSIIMVLVMEIQGQIVLTYLFGYLWMAGRDSFLIDFAFALIGTIGTITFFRHKIEILRLAPFIIVLSALPNLLYTVPTKPIPHYANPLIHPKLPYNGYTAIPGLKDLINKWDYLPYRRVLDPDIDRDVDPIMKYPQNQGTFLLEQTGNVAFHQSLAPARFSELMFFHMAGIAPDDKVSAYSNYSNQKIARLPKVDTKGFSRGTIGYIMMWMIPPFDLDFLRLLGIDRIVTRTDGILPGMTQKLKLKNITKSGNFNVAELSDTLPRTFLVTNVTNDNLKDFKENMKPKINMCNDQDLEMSNIYKAQAASILEYKREYVAIDVKSPSGGYLVLTDVFHPYWSASIDGKPAEIIPAFHAFRAVKTPPGIHRIEFFCRVPNFKKAFLISFILIAVSLPVTFILWRKKVVLPSTS